MNDSRRTPTVVLVAWMLLMVGIADTIVYLARAPEPIIKVEVVAKPKRLTRPQECAHLLREVNESEWDAETDTYPPNLEWENCMGVGR